MANVRSEAAMLEGGRMSIGALTSDMRDVMMNDSDDEETYCPLLGVYDLIDSEEKDLSDMVIDEIMGLEDIIESWHVWGVGGSLLMKAYQRGERGDLEKFVMRIIRRFGSMTPAEQCEVGDFLLSIDPVRLRDISLEVSTFVASVLVDSEISKLVVIAFLKLLLRLCDLNELRQWAFSGEAISQEFLMRMWLLADECDDDELREYLAPLI